MLNFIFPFINDDEEPLGNADEEVLSTNIVSSVPVVITPSVSVSILEYPMSAVDKSIPLLLSISTL